MKRVLIPLAQGCEELEAVTLVDLLRRANITVITAGLDDKPVVCSHQTTLIPDTSLDAILQDPFDMIILPGGLPGTNHLNADPRIHALLQKMNQEEKWIAAICAAPLVLANNGLLTGKNATCYPGSLPDNYLGPPQKVQHIDTRQ